MASAGDFGAKSSSIINYTTYKDFPILSNHKKYQKITIYKLYAIIKIQISCFTKKNDFNNDFIAISNHFPSLQTVCY